ncbi:hypothetical protein KCU79_g44, partial [Aureobasidium melanogenum]
MATRRQLHPLPHTLQRQGSSMPLFGDNVLSIQETRANCTTRSEYDNGHCAGSQESDPAVCNHTSSLGIPSKVQQPEVGR